MAKKDKRRAKEHQNRKVDNPKATTSRDTLSEAKLVSTNVYRENDMQRKSLAPVFVPNKFKSDFETYSEIVRNGPAALRPSKSKLNTIMAKEKLEVIRKLETKGSNLEGFVADPLTCRPSRPSPPSSSVLSSLPSVEKLSSKEQLSSKKQLSFLPKIQNSSKNSITQMTIKEKYISADAPNASPSNFVQESCEIRILPQTKMGTVSLLSQRQQVQPILVRKPSIGEVASPNSAKTSEMKLPVPPSLPKQKDLLSVNTPNIRHRKIKIRQRRDSFNVKNK